MYFDKNGERGGETSEAKRKMRTLAAETFRRRADDDWRHCLLAGQGSTGDGCSVRDLGCIVSVRRTYARSQTYEGEPKRAHTRRSLSFPLSLSSLSLSLCLSFFLRRPSVLGRRAAPRRVVEFSAGADVTRVTFAAFRIDRAQCAKGPGGERRNTDGRK